MIFTYDRPEIPVDTHVYRVGTPAGTVPPRASFYEAHDEILLMGSAATRTSSTST